MRKLLVDNKYELPIPIYLDLDAKKTGSRPAYASILKPRVMASVAKNAWCTVEAYKYVIHNYEDLNGANIIEYFGGMGCVTAKLYHECSTHSHIVVDIDESLARYLRETFPGIEVLCANTFDLVGTIDDIDLAIWDSPNNTLKRLVEKGEFYYAFKKDLVRDTAPTYAIITDTGWGWIHLHVEKYKALGLPVCGRDNYLEVLSDTLYDMYGYSIRFAATHKEAAHFVVTKGKPKPFDKVRAEDYGGKDFVRLLE